MASINVTIKNLPQIRAAFSKAPMLMTRELNTAIRRSIVAIQGVSMRNTPVDTGRLRASTQTLFGPLRGEVGTHVFYDIFVHDGTKYMKARPFLLNAVNTEDAFVQGEFTGAVTRVLDQIGGET